MKSIILLSTLFMGSLAAAAASNCSYDLTNATDAAVVSLAQASKLGECVALIGPTGQWSIFLSGKTVTAGANVTTYAAAGLLREFAMLGACVP